MIQKKEGDKIINIFSTKSINFFSFIMSIVIILILNIVIHNIEINCGKHNYEMNYKEIISKEKDKKEKIETKSELGNFNWYIEIPIISLKAPIQETVKLDILNNYVGHFEETSKTEGNIGLAGHNRGYKNNFFENVNKLKKGDEIKYKYYEFEKSYYIEKIETIKSTNWDYLDNSNENKITLITCIENKPDLRLCIQAIQK